MLIKFALAYCTCVLLCLAMNRHSAQIFPNYKLTKGITRLLAVCGWLLLIVTTAVCVTQDGTGTGLVILCGVLTAAVFVLALLLNYAARWIPIAGILYLAAGLAF